MAKVCVTGSGVDCREISDFSVAFWTRLHMICISFACQVIWLVGCKDTKVINETFCVCEEGEKSRLDNFDVFRSQFVINYIHQAD